MFQSNNDWTISLSGCGFLSVYYFGVYSCLLDRAHNLIKRTTRICGASSGALIGAMIACKMSPAKCCDNLMELYEEARKGMLGTMHPSFNMLKLTRKLMVRDLPENAHVLTSGKLFVSMTRVSDGENVIVSEFSSKDDLVQALVCSCFFPLYCGVIPPSYRGVRCVDGALSNNLPYFSLKNTITVSPFSGESDISPCGNPFYFHEIRHSNVSIQVNFANAHRVVQAFFPPEPEVMSEVCLNGYKDTLNFLQVNALLEQDAFKPGLRIFDQDPCVLFSCDDPLSHTNPDDYSKFMLDEDRGPNYPLPELIQTVFQRAGRPIAGWTGVMSIIMVFVLPAEWIYFTFLRLAAWMPQMVPDLLWMWTLLMQWSAACFERITSVKISALHS